MSEYIPTIGLEIHAELATSSKMFCRSKNNPDETTPNTNICPVCMAHPGTLPTVNKTAVEYVLRVGVAIDGTLADYSEFDRKNYFYPDIPKAYQLSQYEYPLVSGGILQGIAITRIHLEEDTARSLHTADTETSYVDFNRAGVPLMELVTEPEIHSGAQAAAFGRELRILLRTLGVSHANMEKGEMRVEVNISIAKDGEDLGTKVEIKNLNSFKTVEKATEYEIKRQAALLDRGEEILQETRGWDDGKAATFSQRIKEEAADYRYFPDPDIPKFKISEIPEFSVEYIRSELPELPESKRRRLKESYDLSDEVIEIYVYDTQAGAFFDAVTQVCKGIKDEKEKIRTASNYIVNSLLALKDASDEGVHIVEKIDPKTFRDLIELTYQGEISSNGTVELIQHLTHSKTSDIHALAKEKGLLVQNDEEALTILVDTVLSENEDAANEYKAGKEPALQYLVGQGMKASKGSGNPAKIKEILLQKLA